jgi:hypothetical protein
MMARAYIWAATVIGATAIASVGVVACDSDPVWNSRKDALGDEKPGIDPGEYHRAGQPCTLCHMHDGPAPDFSLAGTVFVGKNGLVGMDGVRLLFIDTLGSRYEQAVTNCVGNFFVRREQYNPAFPVLVALEKDGTLVKMASPIFRDGSCASCHTSPASPDSPGQVYFTTDPAFEANYVPPPCPVNPVLAPPAAPAPAQAAGTR